MSTLDSEVLEFSAPSVCGSINGVVVGTLIAFRDEGLTPLVLFPGHAARLLLRPPPCSTCTVPMLGKGRADGRRRRRDSARNPLSLLRRAEPRPLPEQLGHVEVDSDGERLLVSAKGQLVLKCGRASITLTRAGKVILQGTHVSHRSSDVMRIKGGSIQLN